MSASEPLCRGKPPRTRSFMEIAGLWLLLALFVALPFIRRVGWPAALRIASDTTVLTGPLRPDGTIDYARAVDDEYALGVTPDTNAAIPLMNAVGPGIISADVRAEFFRRLGVEPVPVEGNYLQSEEQFFGSDRESLERFRVQFPVASVRPWDAEAFPEVARWLAANESSLKLCEGAFQKERLYAPIISPGSGQLIDAGNGLISQCRLVARLLSVRGTWYLEAGQTDDALADAASIHRLSGLVSQHPLPIGQMLSRAIEVHALGLHAAAALSGRLTIEQARRQQQMIRSLPPLTGVARVFGRAERFQTLEILVASFNQTYGARLAFDVNVMLRHVNRTFDEFDSAMRQPTPRAQQEAIAAVEIRILNEVRKEPSHWELLMSRREGLSRWVSSMSLESGIWTLKQGLAGERRLRSARQMAVLGFVLAEHRANHGRFPESLASLTPEHFATVPQDVYCEGPVRYRVDSDGARFLLYSVGENGVDDGGLSDGTQGADDIAFGSIPWSAESPSTDPQP